MAANPSIQLGTDGNWAIKEDNLLAYKQDGTRFFNKEFNFSRGSLATFVDKDGLIKVSGVTSTELVVNGGFDTDSNWVKGNGWTISDGKADFIGSAYGEGISQSSVTTLNKVYAFSCDIIQGSIDVKVGSTSYFPYSGGTIYVTANNASSNAIVIRPLSSNVSIDNVSVVEVQTDVPRIDFKDDTTGHLLLEPQSTNLVTYSEDFTQYISSAATLESGYLAPDGSNNAYKVSGTVGTSALYKPSINPTSTATRTIYARTVSGTGQAHLTSYNSNSNNLFTITEDWQRFEVNGTTTTTGEHNFYAIDFRGSTNLSEVLIWGGQVEELPYATSYIPTSGSTVTRNAEVCNNSGSVQDFNSEEGVLYAEVSALADDGTNRQISISDGTAANRIYFGFRTNENEFIISSRDSTYVIDTVSDITNFNKYAFQYKLGSFKVFVNGLEYDLDADGGLLPTSLNKLSFDNGVGTQNFYGKCKDLRVFKRALSDGKLYLLTVKQYQSYQEMATALNYTL